MPPRKLLTKTKVGYKIIALLVYYRKALKKDLDLQRDPITKNHTLTNGTLMSKYLNYNKMIDGKLLNNKITPDALFINKI